LPGDRGLGGWADLSRLEEAAGFALTADPVRIIGRPHNPCRAEYIGRHHGEDLHVDADPVHLAKTLALNVPLESVLW
jgi:hypothetical protein